MLVAMSAPHPGLPALRVGVALAVPVLALAAHGLATGSVPGPAGTLVCAVLGVGLAGLVGAQSHRVPPMRLAVVLALGQVLGHPASAIGDAVVGPGHPAHIGAMALWHAVAVPASALLLMAVARCYALVTSVLAVLGPVPGIAPVGELPVAVGGWGPRGVLAGAGADARAPPVRGLA